MLQTRQTRPLLAAVRRYSSLLGKSVRVVHGTRRLAGTAVDLDALGQLILIQPDGARTIVSAGDARLVHAHRR
jgi:biotin-(acetyl-CoA carboxylase) ligase